MRTLKKNANGVLIDSWTFTLSKCTGLTFKELFFIHVAYDLTTI